MSTLLTIIELAAKAGVAVVLVSSGVAKLAGLTSAQHRGLPKVVALLDRRAARLGLGGLELGVGAISLLALASPLIDALALATCAAFFVGSAVLGVITPGTACRCFGAASSSAFGLRHTIETGVLAAAAAVAYAGSLDGAGTPSWSSHPLMLVTLIGTIVLAARVRALPDPAARRVP